MKVFYRNPVFLIHTISYGSLVAWLLQSSFLKRHQLVRVTRSLLNGSYQKHLRNDVRKTARDCTIVNEKSEQCMCTSVYFQRPMKNPIILFCFFVCLFVFRAFITKQLASPIPLWVSFFSISPVFIFCLCIPLTVGKTSTEWVWERWTVEEIAKTGEKTEIWNPEVRRRFADVLEWYVPFGCGDLGCLPLSQNIRKCHLKVKWNNNYYGNCRLTPCRNSSLFAFGTRRRKFLNHLQHFRVSSLSSAEDNSEKANCKW